MEHPSDHSIHSRIAVKLSNAAQKKLLSGHPWIFEQSIQKISGDPMSGDLAVLYHNKSNKFIGIGLFDMDSVIRIKVIQFGTASKIDQNWIKNKIQLAYDLRATLRNEQQNSYRLIYGENDGLPGIIVDVYDKVAVLKLYSQCWKAYLDIIIDAIMEQCSTDALILRLSRNMQKNSEVDFLDGSVLKGKLLEEDVVFLENGLKFKANVIHGHKTGFFLDHRQNRIAIGRYARNNRVLDVFSYAGGFSVHALANGAKHVTSLDISAKALEIAKENAALNTHKGTHEIMAIDAFLGLNQLYEQGKKFDVVIIDPPSFAKKKEEIPKAIISYRKLTVLGLRLVSKHGLLVMASCSSRIDSDTFFEIVENELKNARIPFEIVTKTYHDIDHPIRIAEAAYLKCGYYKFNNKL